MTAGLTVDVELIRKLFRKDKQIIDLASSRGLARTGLGVCHGFLLGPLPVLSIVHRRAWVGRYGDGWSIMRNKDGCITIATTCSLLPLNLPAQPPRRNLIGFRT